MMRGLALAEEAVDLWGAFFSLAWGAFLLAPWRTFSTSPSYGSLAAVGITEESLGLWLAVLGAIGVTSQSVSPTRWPLLARRLSMLALCGSWWGIAAFFAHANPAATAWPTYGGIALLLSFSYARRW